jgi:deoxyribonuclease-4
MVGAAERIRAITGRIDLVHANDSKDGAGSGRDRHEHLGCGEIDPDVLAEVIRAAGAPDVVCETALNGVKDDIVWIRDHL